MGLKLDQPNRPFLAPIQPKVFWLKCVNFSKQAQECSTANRSTSVGPPPPAPPPLKTGTPRRRTPSGANKREKRERN